MQMKMSNPFSRGVLASASPVVVQMCGAPLPCTITLKSGAAGRKVEISTDDGVEFVTPQPDSVATTATQYVVTLDCTVSHVRITGAAGDTWSMR